MQPSLPPRPARLVDNSFLLAVLAKGLGGLVELTAGVLLIFMSAPTLQHLLEPLARVGLNPESSISNGTKLFVVIYFSVRGSLRLVLATCLLQEQLWAYPAAMVLLGAAIVYQVWLLATGHFSHALLALTLFDTLVVVLTGYEYRKLRCGGHLSRPHL